MHLLGASLEECVELGALLEHLPTTFEAGGHDEGVAHAELPAPAAGVFQCDAASREAAELGLGVTDPPLAGRARPAARVELLGGIRIVVGDELAGLAFQDPLR